jgi:hypothetical protein
MDKTIIIIENEGFLEELDSPKLRGIKKEVLKEKETLRQSDTGKRLYKNLFEKYIKDDFRLYYFKYNFSEKTFIVLFFVLVSSKKNQTTDIKKIKKTYTQRDKLYRQIISEKFNL